MRPIIRPRVRHRLLAAGAAAALLAACSPVGDSPAPTKETSAVNATAEGATSNELISAALEAGKIDEATGLVYRTWAMFGGDQLPIEYQGASAPHDLALLAEVSAALEGLPAEAAAQVEPFLKRPADPASAFTDDDAPVTTNAATGAGGGGQPCAQGWTSAAQAGSTPQFRGWVCNDVGTTAQVESALATLLEEVDAYAPAIVAAMGPLLPDEPGANSTQGGDDLIDIYVLPEGFLAPYRDGDERRMDPGTAGITMRADPREGAGSSAYVLLSAQLLTDRDRLTHTLVHELSHVAQFARNWDLVGTASGWAYEATAAWAEHHFAPDASGGVNNRVRILQASPLSLHSNEGYHPYSAAVWMMYLEQEFGAEFIFDLWSALEAATESDAAITIIGEQLGDWDVHAPAFALRLLNADLPGDPIPVRFAHLDPRIPDGAVPDVAPLSFGDGPLSVEFDDVPGLGYRFARVRLAGGSPGGVPPHEHCQPRRSAERAGGGLRRGLLSRAAAARGRRAGVRRRR